MVLPEVFSRYRSHIDAGLRSALGNEDSPLLEMLRYHLGWGDEEGHPSEGNSGKAIRPALCLFSCEALGGAWQRALPAAVAVELIHNFSLIHDDIQDGDTERHHRPTVWYVWGHGHGLNAGVAMNVLGNLALCRAEGEPVEAETVLRVSEILTRACAEMIEGQALDLSFEGRPRVGVKDYLTMIGKKTGALLACSLHMGAVIGAKDQGSVDGMRRFGAGLGLVFQVRDDMLGVWGQQDKTGKPRASDLHRRKKSLPVVHALSSGEGEGRRRFLDIYGSERPLTEEDIDELLGVMEETGTHKYCEELAMEHGRRSLEAIELVEMSSQAKREATEMTQFLLERDY